MPVDADELVLERLRDRGLDDLGRGAGETVVTETTGGSMSGNSRFGEARQRDRAEEHDDERHHGREDRPLDRVPEIFTTRPLRLRALAARGSAPASGSSFGGDAPRRRRRARACWCRRPRRRRPACEPRPDLDEPVLADAELDVDGRGLLLRRRRARRTCPRCRTRPRCRARASTFSRSPEARLDGGEEARPQHAGPDSAPVPSPASGGSRVQARRDEGDRRRRRPGRGTGATARSTGTPTRASGSASSGSWNASSRVAIESTCTRSYSGSMRAPDGDQARRRRSRRTARGCGCARPRRAPPRGAPARLRASAVTSSSCEGATMPSRGEVARAAVVGLGEPELRSRPRAGVASCSSSRSRKRTWPFVTGCALLELDRGDDARRPRSAPSRSARPPAARAAPPRW